MNKLFDNLPKLTNEEKEKVEAITTKTNIIDNFTVKKCPLMDNFDTMEPYMWNNIGSPVTSKNNEKINAEIQTLGKDNMCMLSSSKRVPVETGAKTTIPFIHGITSVAKTEEQPATESVDSDGETEDDDESSYLMSTMNIDTPTKMYVGALSLVGLFILFRVVKKTM
jgi:hypothetical protein